MAKSNPPPLQLVLRSDVADIQRLADAIDGYCASHGVPTSLSHQLALVSDELMTNTMSYGGANLTIEVEMRLEDDRVTLSIIDNGIPVRPPVRAAA